MQYSVFEQRCVTPDGEAYTGYGLRCEGERGGVRFVREIPDVTTEETFARSVAAQCNEGCLDPVLFESVALDAALEPSAFQ